MLGEIKRFLTDREGQIGPVSLEDIPALTIMLIITMVLMVLIFKIVGGYLETNRAVDMHTSAVELSSILESKSELVYEVNGIKRPGVLDENSMAGFDLSSYGFIEYECMVEIEDLRDDMKFGPWGASPPDTKNIISSVSPVAVHRNDGGVHEGLLKVYIWGK